MFGDHQRCSLLFQWTVRQLEMKHWTLYLYFLSFEHQKTCLVAGFSAAVTADPLLLLACHFYHVLSALLIWRQVLVRQCSTLQSSYMSVNCWGIHVEVLLMGWKKCFNKMNCWVTVLHTSYWYYQNISKTSALLTCCASSCALLLVVMMIWQGRWHLTLSSDITCEMWRLGPCCWHNASTSYISLAHLKQLAWSTAQHPPWSPAVLNCWSCLTTGMFKWWWQDLSSKPDVCFFVPGHCLQDSGVSPGQTRQPHEPVPARVKSTDHIHESSLAHRQLKDIKISAVPRVP